MEKYKEVFARLKEQRVVIVEAQGGALSPDFFITALNGYNGQITVTEPQRALVQSVCQNVACQIGCQVGKHVGYQLSGYTRTSDTTRMVFRVDQSVSMFLARRQNGLGSGLLIVDRAYDRSLQLDFLLGQIALNLNQSPQSHIILVSPPRAENVREGEAHLLDLLTYRFPQAPVIRLEHNSSEPSSESCEVLKGEYLWTAAVRKVKELMEEREPATVLLLLATRQDVKKSCKALNGLRNTEVFSYHSKLDSHDQQRIWNATPGKWRIVCSTNALRGVSLPGLLYVIDAQETVRMSEDRFGVRRHLVVSVSEVDVHQAKQSLPSGGRYIGLGTDVGLRAYPEPAIKREPATGVAMQIANRPVVI